MSPGLGHPIKSHYDLSGCPVTPRPLSRLLIDCVTNHLITLHYINGGTLLRSYVSSSGKNPF